MRGVARVRHKDVVPQNMTELMRQGRENCRKGGVRRAAEIGQISNDGQALQ